MSSSHPGGTPRFVSTQDIQSGQSYAAQVRRPESVPPNALAYAPTSAASVFTTASTFWLEINTPSSSKALPTFTAHVCNSQSNPIVRLGPLVDDGAPYSAISADELPLIIGSQVNTQYQITLEPIPDDHGGAATWKYCVETHAGFERMILGSFPIQFITDSRTVVSVRHCMIEQSSQWVLGENITDV